MYYIIYFLIIICSVLEINRRKIFPHRFLLFFLLLTIMLACRYGQGTDYFNYRQIYEELFSLGNESFFLLFAYPDVGFAIISFVFASLDIPFEIFLFCIALLTMFFFFRFLKMYCNSSMLGIFVFYSVIFLIFPFSAIRQGLVMAIILGGLFPLMIKKKYVAYYIILIIVSTIHASAFIALIFPLLWNYKISNKIIFLIFLIFSAILFLNINLLSFLRIDRISSYVGEGSSNFILAKFARLIVIFPLFLLPKKWLCDNYIAGARNLLFGGYLVYVLMSFSELSASRLWGYFLGFECLLICLILRKKNFLKLKFFLLLYYLLFNVILWFKDVHGFIDQGEYQNCSMFSYPYISVFDSNETLLYYRPYSNIGEIDE